MKHSEDCVNRRLYREPWAGMMAGRLYAHEFVLWQLPTMFDEGR